MSMRPHQVALCAMAASCLLGCASEPSFDTTAREGGPGLTAASLEGQWQVSASGTRYACGGEYEEGKLELSLKPFMVNARAVSSPPVSVALTANIGDNVQFEGGGGPDGDLHFTIAETLSNDDMLVYAFEGVVEDADLATGTFTGTGPGECQSRGKFTLRRR